jgi:hypothetical protein
MVGETGVPTAGTQLDCDSLIRLMGAGNVENRDLTAGPKADEPPDQERLRDRPLGEFSFQSE